VSDEDRPDERPAKARKQLERPCQRCYKPFGPGDLTLVDGLMLCGDCADTYRRDSAKHPYVVATLIACAVIVLLTVVGAIIGPIVAYRTSPAYALQQLREAISSGNQTEFVRLYDSVAIRQALAAEATAADAEAAASADAAMRKLLTSGDLTLDREAAAALAGSMSRVSLMTGMTVDQKVQLIEKTIVMSAIGTARVKSVKGDTAVAQGLVQFPSGFTPITFAVQFDMRRVPGPGGAHWKVIGIREVQGLRPFFT
jgi:hypothetical protein